MYHKMLTRYILSESRSSLKLAYSSQERERNSFHSLCRDFLLPILTAKPI